MNGTENYDKLSCFFCEQKMNSESIGGSLPSTECNDHLAPGTVVCEECYNIVTKEGKIAGLSATSYSIELQTRAVASFMERATKGHITPFPMLVNRTGLNLFFPENTIKGFFQTDIAKAIGEVEAKKTLDLVMESHWLWMPDAFVIEKGFATHLPADNVNHWRAMREKKDAEDVENEKNRLWGIKALSL